MGRGEGMDIPIEDLKELVSCAGTLCDECSGGCEECIVNKYEKIVQKCGE